MAVGKRERASHTDYLDACVRSRGIVGKVNPERLWGDEKPRHIHWRWWQCERKAAGQISWTEASRHKLLRCSSPYCASPYSETLRAVTDL